MLVVRQLLIFKHGVQRPRGLMGPGSRTRQRSPTLCERFIGLAQLPQPQRGAHQLLPQMTTNRARPAPTIETRRYVLAVALAVIVAETRHAFAKASSEAMRNRETWRH